MPLPDPMAVALLEHGQFLHRLARGLVHDSSTADDVVQETYLAALLHPPHRMGNPRGWLATVARNFALRTRRAEARRLAHERASAKGEALHSTEEVAQRLELSRLLVGAVLALPEPYRSTIVYRYLDDLSVREIARRMGGVPERTVQTRLRRGIYRLRVRLDSDRGDRRGSWTLALMPLAGTPSRSPTATVSGTTAPFVTGGLVVGTKISLAAAAALVAGAFGSGWTLRPWLAPEERAQTASPVAMDGPRAPASTPQLTGRLSSTSTPPAPVASVPSAPAQTDAQSYLRRINEAPNAKSARPVFVEITGLAPETAQEIVLGIFRDIRDAGSRLACIELFARSRFALELFHFGATDPDLSVQTVALRFASNFGFRDFTEDRSAYLDWWERNKSLSQEAVVRSNAIALVSRLRDLDEEASARELRSVERVDFGALRGAVEDPAATLREGGILEVVASWIDASGSTTKLKQSAIGWVEKLGPDEGWLRAHVLPLVENPAANDGEVVIPAYLLLGKPGNPWAFDPLVLAFTRTPRKSDWSFIAMALVAMGDPRAISTMIGMIQADNTYDSLYGIGYFGLSKWTGVRYDETHDAAWWRSWMQKNQERLPEAVRGAPIPVLSPLGR